MRELEVTLSMSVVIPTCNRREALRNTLLGLFQQDYPSDRFEIVVVVDGSSDGTEAMLQSLRPPCALKWFVQENKGPSAARNRGIREASGEVIVFLDDDLDVEPSLLSEHATAHRTSDRAVVMGEILLGVDPSEVSPFEDVFRGIRLDDLTLPGDACLCANTSVRREHLLEIDGFDEDFRLMVDSEVGIRLYEKGLSFRGNPRAVVHHKPVGGIETLITKTAYWRGYSAVKLFRKHPEPQYREIHGLFREFLEEKAPKRALRQLCLACGFCREVGRSVFEASFRAARALRLPPTIWKRLAIWVYFTYYCRGARAAGVTLSELRKAC